MVRISICHVDDKGSNPFMPVSGINIYFMLLQCAKLIGAGLATISLAGSGIGIGSVFAGLMEALSRNPFQKKQLFVYAILGFALTEAIALFGLMMAFLILFAF